MSKKIFFAQDWENVPSEIQQTDMPSITPLYKKVEEDDVEHIVREIEQRAIDITRLCQNADTAFFYAQSPDFLKPGLCYYPKFSYL